MDLHSARLREKLLILILTTGEVTAGAVLARYRIVTMVMVKLWYKTFG